jgi:DNA replication protein DnaC
MRHAVTVRPISNDDDLATGFERAGEIICAERGTPEASELDVLSTLIVAYERNTHGAWLKEKRNVALIGPCGAGKTFIASALTHRACDLGFNARYCRLPRLLQELQVARADGTYTNRLLSLEKVDLLVLDDWGIAPLEPAARRDLLEILDDRYLKKSPLIAAQMPVENWHAWIADPALADAILDRLVHNAYRLELKGESQRKLRGIPEGELR